MESNIEKLKKIFLKVKQKGWIESKDISLGSIGNTFEKLIGIEKNELEIPDFNGIEIKTKRQGSLSHINLFNCTPTGPHYHEVERLKNDYGYPDTKLKMHNVLNTSVYCGKKVKVGYNFFFELKADKQKEKLYLIIYDKFGNLIENKVYWDFDILKEKLYRKLKYLALIKAYSKKSNNKKYFKYFSMKFFSLKGFDEFIYLIEQGIIRITFKIGIFRDNLKKGKIHDHGTSFCIQEKDLDKLYNLLRIC